MLMDLWDYEQVCTAKMNLSEEVDLEDYVSRPDKISAAEVRSTFMIPLLPDYSCKTWMWIRFIWTAYLNRVVFMACRYLQSVRKLVCMQYGRIGMLFCPKILRRAIDPMLKNQTPTLSSTDKCLSVF